MAARPARSARRAAVAAAALLLPALAGCAAGDGPDVMATFYPLEFLAQRVAGDPHRVESVVRAGVEPHDYEPTPADLRDIVGARALVILGAGFEGWLRTVQEQAPGTRLVVATEGLDLRPAGAPPDGLDGEGEGEKGGAGAGEDPHTWLDPVLAQRMARAIERGLAAAFPGEAGAFAQNADRLVADLQALDAEFRAGLADCRVRAIITGHDAFGYLAARYGFEQVAVQGLDPHGEPDPQAIERVIDEARARGIGVIFFEDLVSPAVAEAIAREVGARTLLLSPIESLPAPVAAQGGDYLDAMRLDLAHLRDGMECA